MSVVFLVSGHCKAFAHTHTPETSMYTQIEPHYMHVYVYTNHDNIFGVCILY